MRQYGEVPPWLAADNTPKVVSATGLGTGGGAAIQTPDSGGFGEILLYVGPGYTQSGSVVIRFPSTPPTLFIAANNFRGLSQNTVGNDVTISWTSVLFTSNNPETKAHHIHYEWSVSK